jgi:hydrogenase/urease accessory protein HupE
MKALRLSLLLLPLIAPAARAHETRPAYLQITETHPSRFAVVMGFVIATGLLHGVGIGIGSVHRWDAGRVALRVAGAVVLGAGILFFWKALI